jgi:signal transduction histidine kinase
VRGQRDLHAIAEQALDDVRATWPGRDVEHEPLGRASSALGADRMAQLISNLVNNALQHSPAATKVVVQTRGELDAVVLTVTNYGPAIPAELPSPLRRGSDAGQRRGSLGLGLFIVQHLVIAHGGTIDVRSSAGAPASAADSCRLRPLRTSLTCVAQRVANAGGDASAADGGSDVAWTRSGNPPVTT